jgi:hypothetical protein
VNILGAIAIVLTTSLLISCGGNSKIETELSASGCEITTAIGEPGSGCSITVTWNGSAEILSYGLPVAGQPSQFTGGATVSKPSPGSQPPVTVPGVYFVILLTTNAPGGSVNTTVTVACGKGLKPVEGGCQR